MALNILSIDNLKNFKLYPDVRTDPLFKNLIRVCRNDIEAKNTGYKPSMYFTVYGFFSYAGFFIPQFLFFIYMILYENIIYELTGGFSNGVHRILLILSCITSIIISLVTSYVGRFTTAVNIFFTAATFIAPSYFDTELHITCLFCMSIQLIVRIMSFSALNKKQKNELKKHLNEVEKVKSKYLDFEKFYEKTVQQADERIRLFQKELNNRGIATDLDALHYWWKNPEFKYPLSQSGDLFYDNHVARYEYSATYDKYDFSGEKIEKKTSHYTNVYSKKFFMQTVPVDIKRNILYHIQQAKFESLGTVDLKSLDIEKSNIVAIGCKWTIFENTDTETVIKMHPTQEQIDNAKRDIHLQENRNERFRNAYFKGVPLTTEELFYATGGKGVSVEEQMYSDDRRRNAMDKYIKDNTYDDVSRDNYKNESDNMAIFMYKIDNYVFFNRNAPLCYINPKYNYDSGNNWISSREAEIEEVLNYLIKNDHDFAVALINDLWGGQKNEYYSQLTSKIFHTIATLDNYNQYFN